MPGSLPGVLFDGVAYGSLLFLMSVGLSVTMGMMNFINIAHGAFAMAGGYVCSLGMERLGIPFAYDPGPGVLSMQAITDPPAYHRARAAVRYDDIARAPRSAQCSSARSTAHSTGAARSTRCSSRSA